MQNNRWRFSLFLSRQPSTAMPVLNFSLDRVNFNQDYQLMIKCPKKIKLSKKDLYSVATLEVLHDGGVKYFSGIIINIKQSQTTGATEIIVASTLFLLKRQYNQRVFVNKTWGDIIRQIVMTYDLPIQFPLEQIKILGAYFDLTSEMLVQKQCSDYEFLKNILRENNLGCFFQSVNQPLRLPKLIFHSFSNQLLNSSDVKLLVLTRNKIIDCQWVLSNHPQPKVLTAITTECLLEVGMMVSLFDQKYIVLSVAHFGDQASGFVNISHQKTAITYYNKVSLIPVDNLSEFTLEKKTGHFDDVVSGLYQAITETHQKNSKNQSAYLTDKGKYHIRYPFDKSASLPGMGSNPMSLQTGMDQGLFGSHFPLRGDTLVGIIYESGKLHQGSISGALGYEKNRVSDYFGQVSTHRLGTWGDNLIELEDSSGKQSVLLKTNKNKINIKLDATEEAENITCQSRVGALLIQAKKTALFNSRQASFKTVVENYELEVGINRILQIEERDINLTAHQDFNIESKSHFQIQNTKTTLNIEQHFNWYTHRSLSINVTQNDFDLFSETGNILFSSGKDLSVCGQAVSAVVVAQGGVKMVFAPNGCIQFTAEEIVFQASKIEVVTPEVSHL